MEDIVNKINLFLTGYWTYQSITILLLSSCSFVLVFFAQWRRRWCSGATKCGRSSTMHRTSSNALAMAFANVRACPPARIHHGPHPMENHTSHCCRSSATSVTDRAIPSLNSSLKSITPWHVPCQWHLPHHPGPEPLPHWCPGTTMVRFNIISMKRRFAHLF